MSLVFVAPVGVPRVGILRRILDASVSARARQAERHFAPYIAMYSDLDGGTMGPYGY